MFTNWVSVINDLLCPFAEETCISIVCTVYSVCTRPVSSFILTLAGKWAPGIRVLKLTADELSVLGTVLGTEQSIGQVFPVLTDGCQDIGATLPTPDTAVLRRGKI